MSEWVERVFVFTLTLLTCIFCGGYIGWFIGGVLTQNDDFAGFSASIGMLIAGIFLFGQQIREAQDP